MMPAANTMLHSPAASEHVGPWAEDWKLPTVPGQGRGIGRGRLIDDVLLVSIKASWLAHHTIERQVPWHKTRTMHQAADIP